MKNENQMKIKFEYQEKSEIKCPNCGEEMVLINENEEKRGVCKNCGYIEKSHE